MKGLFPRDSQVHNYEEMDQVLSFGDDYESISSTNIGESRY